MSGTSSKKSRYLIVSGGILLLAIIGIIGFIIVRGQLKEKNYLEAIKTAEKYKEEENYADAIVAYKNAIKEAPKKAEAYLNLADVHLIQNQVSEAKLTLRKGYVKTNSQKIKYMLNGIEDGTLLLQYEKDDTDKKELFEVRGEFGWNTSFLQKLENYTFQDYQDEYGNFPEILKTGAGKLEVVHRDLKGICYYSNTKEDNEIVDVKKNKPDVAGMPQTITLDSVSLLFRNFNGSVSLDQLRKLSGEKVEPVRTDERTYVTLKTGDVIIKIETDASGNVTSENAWNEIQLPNANKNRGKKGHLSGVVIDAVSGDGVAGAVLEFKAEKNRASSSETNTKNDGSFSIELEEDVYSVKISAEGYLMEEFEFEIEKNKNYSGEQFVISPELAGKCQNRIGVGSRTERLGFLSVW